MPWLTSRLPACRQQHGNGPATNTQALPPTDELTRAAVYVCMAPKARASAETLARRREAMSVGHGTGTGAFCTDAVRPIVAEADPAAELVLGDLNPAQLALVG